MAAPQGGPRLVVPEPQGHERLRAEVDEAPLELLGGDLAAGDQGQVSPQRAGRGAGPGRALERRTLYFG